MGYVGFKTNPREEKDLEELETLLRSMDPLQKIGNRSAAVKEAVRIALFHLKQSYFYDRDLTFKTQGLTAPEKSGSVISQTRYIERIKSSDIDIEGRRRDKKA